MIGGLEKLRESPFRPDSWADRGWQIEKLKQEIAEKDKRIAELESWLKPFHGTAEDVAGYESEEKK